MVPLAEIILAKNVVIWPCLLRTGLSACSQKYIKTVDVEKMICLHMCEQVRIGLCLKCGINKTTSTTTIHISFGVYLAHYSSYILIYIV